MSVSHFIKWTMWGVASIFYAYQYVLRVMPNIMLNDIMARFSLSEVSFGQFSGIYYIGYSLMHLPIGIMLDRYGPRKVMTACILMTVVGLLPIIFSEHWMFSIMGRALMGIGSSAAILGTFKIIRMAFKEIYFTRMLSFSVTIGLLGAIYGGAPVSYMTEILGYQSVVQIFAVTGVVLAGLTYCIVPEMALTQSTSVFSDIRKVFGNGKVIGLCIFAGLMVGPLEGFADVWGTAFFKTTYEFDNTIASSLPSVIFIGMCFGAPILSFIGERLGNLKTIAGTAVVMMILFGLILIGNMTIPTLSVSLGIVGVCCAYQILAIYTASTFVDESVAGLTTAVANMIIMIFGYAFHSVIGLVIQLFGGAASSTAFVYGISVIPIALMISLVGIILLMTINKKQRL